LRQVGSRHSTSPPSIWYQYRIFDNLVTRRHGTSFMCRYQLFTHSKRNQAAQSVPLFTEPFQRLVSPENQAVTCVSWGTALSGRVLLAAGINNSLVHLFVVGDTYEAVPLWSVKVNPRIRPLALGFPSATRDEVCVVGRDRGEMCVLSFRQ
jgi:hypothetical protein